MDTVGFNKARFGEQKLIKRIDFVCIDNGEMNDWPDKTVFKSAGFKRIWKKKYMVAVQKLRKIKQNLTDVAATCY